MALLDDLKGLLSPEDLAKIEGNPAIKNRIAKGDELYGYYVGEDEPVTPPAAVTPPPAVTPPSTPPPAAGFDLGAIERMLDKRLGDLGKKFENVVTKDDLTTTINREGARLLSQATANADELNSIYMEHRDLTGKPFDRVAFNEFLNKPENKTGEVDKPIGQGASSRFPSIRSAYEAFVSPVRQEREVERRVQEKLKTQSGGQPGFPGSTPPPSTNKIVDILKRRNVAADGGGNTRVDRAAAALAQMESSRQSAAS